jgi:hypothetical protein
MRIRFDVWCSRTNHRMQDALETLCPAGLLTAMPLRVTQLYMVLALSASSDYLPTGFPTVN